MESGQTGRCISDLLVLPDSDALAYEAAKRVVEIAEEAVRCRGRFIAGLTGGSTPRRLYALLGTEPYCTRLPWRKTHLFWGDERAVPPEHPDSNFGMARATLLNSVPIPENQVHRMQAEQADLNAAASRYEAEIVRVFSTQPSEQPPTFDLILLGLGTDGHIASLFPHTQALQETRRWVTPNYIPELQVNRLTLTTPILNRAATILFLVSGVEKATVLQAVLESPPDPERLPAQRIRPMAGRIRWLVDQAAASRLGKATL